MNCNTCNKVMGFADKVNAKSFGGDCVNCTSLHRGKDSRAINNDKDQYLEEKEVLSRNLERVYILAKEGTKSNLIQEIKPYGNLWLLDGSIALKKTKILAEYFVFSSREDAETKLQESKDQVEYEQKALSQFYELKADLQTAAEERHLAVLKRFMRETAFIDRKIVNQALFAVTFNKRFKKLFYKLENDNNFLDYATADVMENALELLREHRSHQ